MEKVDEARALLAQLLELRRRLPQLIKAVRAELRGPAKPRGRPRGSKTLLWDNAALQMVATAVRATYPNIRKATEIRKRIQQHFPQFGTSVGETLDRRLRTPCALTEWSEPERERLVAIFRKKIAVDFEVSEAKVEKAKLTAAIAALKAEKEKLDRKLNTRVRL
jgi:hypothetical protein